LNHGLRCSKCGCQFLVTPSGQVRAQAELPQVRFSCPRCGRSGSIPDVLSVRGAECSSCGLPLVRGPDQQLHGAKEAQALRRAAAEGAAPRRLLAPVRWFVRDGQLRAGWLIVVALAAIGATLAAAASLRSLFETTPHGLARRFTLACLGGRWERARTFLEDDPVQRAEFERWRLRHLSSILDKHRPRGDRVEVAVETLSEAAGLIEFRVRLSSPFLGQRSLEQRWSASGGQWRFDAHATLADENGLPPARSTAAPPRAAKQRPAWADRTPDRPAVARGSGDSDSRGGNRPTSSP
jgi:hypothetical protein